MESPSQTRSQSSQPEQSRTKSDELCLLVPWSNPLVVFAENLGQRLTGRVTPDCVTSSAPDYEFWEGVDLGTRFPTRGFFDSVLAHTALLGLLYAISIWPQTTAHLASPLARTILNEYSISAYLPELHGDTPPRHQTTGKHDPTPAKQEITSLPETPDNLRQTIIAPPQIKLDRDINLPNIVAYAPATPAQPLSASQREAASLRLPAFAPEVIQPTTDTSSLRSVSKLTAFQPFVVEPTPDLAKATPRLTLPAFQPQVVEPTPAVGNISRSATTNLAHLAPHVSEPIPEPPQVGNTLRASGQIIALNLHPAEIHGPVDLPSGNRRGTFAASPTGRPDATGTPGANAASGSGAEPSNARVNAPAGIHVSPAPLSAPISAPNAISSHPGGSNPDTRSKLMAAMRAPLASIPPRPITHETTEPRNEVEKRVFAGRRSYTLLVNMPNLNSATGSWIIHFAERAPGTAPTPIAAPEVIRKPDPAYPMDAIRDGVQGTVILTAVIRADGSVGEVTVAKSLDPRLDRTAAQALSQWLFRPALKDGHPIDLQAVITVPFRANAVAKF